LLRRCGAPFVFEHHPRAAYTGQQLAAVAHVPGDQLAKVVLVVADERLAMLALPASRQVDPDGARALLGARSVRLATEPELAAAFPDCEVGAMPPFGGLYGLPLYLDPALGRSGSVVFAAGTHRDTVRMGFRDFAGLARPMIGYFSYHV
jgi:Ala-tRNA(Pro) deacylase